MIGLSGYYEIGTTTTPTIEQLTHNWGRVRDWIMDWRREEKLEQLIVFTEIGYANQDGTSMHPWDYTRQASPDPEEQALCYESFIRVWHGQEGFGGVFFYNWFGMDSLTDTGYSPRGKPAAQTMKTCFYVISDQSM